MGNVTAIRPQKRKAAAPASANGPKVNNSAQFDYADFPPSEQYVEEGKGSELLRYQFMIWTTQGPDTMAKKAILQVLTGFHASFEYVHPSMETIAAKIGANVKTVKRHVPELEREGWIVRRKILGSNGHRFTLYRLRFPGWFNKETDDWLEGADERRREAQEDYNERHLR